jgi:hypothetical protein
MMIVNPYAVLDALVAFLRLPLSLTLIALGALAWRQWRRAATAEERSAVEDRCYLLLTLAVVVLWLNVLSWPLFYLLLQSYVPEWPGVMCIYGVMQIGAGSMGSSQYLPSLLFALYQVHWLSRSGPLLGRILLLLVLLGVIGLADAAAELTYLLIPKREVFPSAGCCTEALASQRASAAQPLITDAERTFLIAACAAAYAVQTAVLVFAMRSSARTRSVFLLAALALAAVALPSAGRFLADVAAPWLLNQPDHACPYDLIPLAPLAVAAVALHFLGCFATGWANLLHWLGDHPEVASATPPVVQRWLRVAVIAYFSSAATMTVELLLA